jgi:hypothetical protein
VLPASSSAQGWVACVLAGPGRGDMKVTDDGDVSMTHLPIAMSSASTEDKSFRAC